MICISFFNIRKINWNFSYTSWNPLGSIPDFTLISWTLTVILLTKKTNKQTIWQDWRDNLGGGEDGGAVFPGPVPLIYCFICPHCQLRKQTLSSKKMMRVESLSCGAKASCVFLITSQGRTADCFPSTNGHGDQTARAAEKVRVLTRFHTELITPLPSAT